METTIRMVRKPEAARALGRGVSTLHIDINKGLLTKPVFIGTQAKAWPDFEITAINRARIAGKSDDEIRALVDELHAARKVAA